MSLPDRDPFRLRMSLWLVRLAASLAPWDHRREVRAQWEAELLYRWRRFQERDPQPLLLWTLGVFRHAWYLFRTEYTMDLIWQDVKFGMRALKRSRGLIAIAVLSLSIGIGANTSIFSVVDVFMLQPLPYPGARDLHMVRNTNPERGWTQASMSAPDFLELEQQSRSLDLAASRGAIFTLSGDFEADRLRGSFVTPDFFDVLGVPPAEGRGFTPDEGTPGHDHVAIISDGLWKRRFGGDETVLNSTLFLDGEAYTVVGVMPPHFWYRTPGRDIWAPLAFTGSESRASHNLAVLARIRDGFTLEQARGETQQIVARMAEAYPETSAGNGAAMMSLRDDVFDEGYRAGSLISTVAVLFVLLIACANVANLLLTHAAGRDREVALRGALGAGRSRILRQFLTESTLVALMGGLLGLGLAVLGIRGLLAVMPPEFPRTHEIGLSPRVLVFTAGITMLTGILFGLAPALHASKRGLTDSLKEGGRGGGGVRGGRVRKGLVVTEVALALVLLVSSTLLAQGFARIRLADLGFDRADVLTAQTLLPAAQYSDTTAVLGFYAALRERLAAIPGVETVGAVSDLPLRGYSGTWYVPGGQDYEDPEARRIAAFKDVLPGYFDAMDIPILQGRDIMDSDRTGSVPVVVINQSLARQHWPESDPVGQQIVLHSGPLEVIGVVEDTRDAGVDSEQPAMLFLPVNQTLDLAMGWTLEASVPLATLAEPVREAVRSVDPTVPVVEVMPMDALLEEAMGGDLIMARIMGVLALIALALALGGVYGVMAYTVSQRTREMGIRLSLGAQRGSVMAVVVRQGAVLALLGIGVGVAVSLGVTRGLSRFLFGVSPFDLATFAGASAVLLLAGVTATFFPARRATRVDPVVALRTE